MHVWRRGYVANLCTSQCCYESKSALKVQLQKLRDSLLTWQSLVSCALSSVLASILSHCISSPSYQLLFSIHGFTVIFLVLKIFALPKTTFKSYRPICTIELTTPLFTTLSWKLYTVIIFPTVSHPIQFLTLSYFVHYSSINHFWILIMYQKPVIVRRVMR